MPGSPNEVEQKRVSAIRQSMRNDHLQLHIVVSESQFHDSSLNHQTMKEKNHKNRSQSVT